MIDVNEINLLLGKLGALGYLVFMVIFVIILPLIVAMLPASFFYLAFKLPDLIRAKKNGLTLMVSAVILLILTLAVISCTIVPLVLLIGGVLGPLSLLVGIFICGCIFLILIIQLTYDIFFKKVMSNFKRVATGIFIIIYSLPMVSII